jgi:hypothetical protein
MFVQRWRKLEVSSYELVKYFCNICCTCPTVARGDANIVPELRIDIVPTNRDLSRYHEFLFLGASLQSGATSLLSLRRDDSPPYYIKSNTYGNKRELGNCNFVLVQDLRLSIY